MNKISIIVLVNIALGATTFCASKTELEKFEKAIVSGRTDKVRSLLKNYESKNPPAKERQAFVENLARIASDVVTDHKERISLQGNIKDIVTYADREKAQDLSLIGLGGALIALGCWYGKSAYTQYMNSAPGDHDARSIYYKDLVFNVGIASLGGIFGGLLAYRGYACTMQENALKAAEKIETFLLECAGINKVDDED